MRFSFICIIFFLVESYGLSQNDYSWTFSLEKDCKSTCETSTDYPYPVQTYKEDTEVCAKKSLFGQSFVPGFKRPSEDKCYAKNLRNNIFQCLCTHATSRVRWLDHNEGSADCSKTCQKEQQKPLMGDSSSLQVCSTIINDLEHAGFVRKDAKQFYCIAGIYKSNIDQCLCH